MNVSTIADRIVLEIRLTMSGYRVFYDDVGLADDELLDIQSDNSVTIVFVCTNTSTSASIAHAENGSLVPWGDLSREFEPTAEELTLFVFITGASPTSRTLKVKVRSKTIKPGTVYVLLAG